MGELILFNKHQKESLSTDRSKEEKDRRFQRIRASLERIDQLMNELRAKRINSTENGKRLDIQSIKRSRGRPKGSKNKPKAQAAK